MSLKRQQLIDSQKLYFRALVGFQWMSLNAFVISIVISEGFYFFFKTHFKKE